MWRSGADFQSMRPSAADDAADRGRGNHSGQFGLTPHLEGATLTIELAAQEAGMGEIGAGRADEPESPWTGPVIALLRDWGRRAERSHSINYRIAQRLSRFNVALGIPIVILTTFAGTSIFATLGETGIVGFKIIVGLVSVLAAVLASLQTFLRFSERAEKHRVAATRWAAIRREIDEMVSLHPVYPESRGDPKRYLDNLRDRIDKLTTESPESTVALAEARAWWGHPPGRVSNREGQFGERVGQTGGRTHIGTEV